MANNRSVGTRYENIAAGFLRYLGFEILERNYRTKAGEIDIIAREGDTLCFVEVKFRSSEAYGFPSEAVDYRKQKTIIKVSQLYLLSHPFSGAIRYDIVEILDNQIRILRNAFGG